MSSAAQWTDFAMTSLVCCPTLIGVTSYPATLTFFGSTGDFSTFHIFGTSSWNSMHLYKWKWLKWVKCSGFFAWMPVQGCVLGGSFNAYECVNGAFASFQERQRLFKYHLWFQGPRHSKPKWMKIIYPKLPKHVPYDPIWYYVLICSSSESEWTCVPPGGAFATRVSVNARMGPQLRTSAFHDGTMVHKLPVLT